MKHFSTLLDVMSHPWLMRIKKINYFPLKKKHKKTGILCNNEKTRFDQSESNHLIVLLFVYVHLLEYTGYCKNEAPDAFQDRNG